MDKKDMEQLTQELIKYDQVHLLRFADELDGQEIDALYRQISQIDFSLLNEVANGGGKVERGELSPIQAVTVKDVEEKSEAYRKAGIKVIREGKVAAVLLAGGQGTRLGSDKPKGLLNIAETEGKEFFVFEALIHNLMKVVDEVGEWIPLLIMTSDKTHADTTSFLKDKEYFGYKEEYVTFFMQEMCPSVDYEGKIYLEEKGRVALSPNGNGGWFTSLVNAGLLDEMQAKGVEWFNVFAVDNVLQKMADPCFVGAVVEEGYASGAKVVAKVNADEKVGVLCLEDGRPSIVEYYEMTEEIRTLRDGDGDLAYNYGVILNYLFHMEELERIASQRLPFHVVEKKVPFVDNSGKKIEPDEPNGYKFETLILDMVHMLKDCLPYEVERKKEFAPIKNKKGVDSLDSARALLRENGYEV